ncbi:MAG: type II secretion system secretin GspD [Thermodesulfobacteriota bacterium]|nr:type II secretion system secretin GspD [Thermodesulfobacteriota bacterium]
MRCLKRRAGGAQTKTAHNRVRVILWGLLACVGMVVFGGGHHLLQAAESGPSPGFKRAMKQITRTGAALARNVSPDGDQSDERQGGGPPPAGTRNDPKDERTVSVDFNDVELTVFIKFISEITGKNFVVDEHVRDKVTVISPSKISVDEAYRVFESVLEVHGYTTVEAGEIIKIVKSSDARAKSIETRLVDETKDAEDKVVTQIIPLKYADADEIKRLFTPLVSKDSVILSYDSTNMLILTDVYSNIKRLMRILEAIDVTGIGRQVSVIPLEFSDASKLVPILETVFRDSGRGRSKEPVAERVKLVADDRANAVVMLASEAETKQVEELITLLDRKVPQGKERIHVYYLKNADAEELAEVLQSLPGKQAEGAGKNKAPVISKDVNITADTATNSLIIMAERNDFVALEEIIKQLDIPRSMVYIECLIAEVNVSKNFELGVEWSVMGEASYEDKEGGYGGGFGGASDSGYQNIAGMLGPATGVGSLPAGFSLGAFGEAIEIGGVLYPNVAAIVQAFKKDKNVHILSTPQIMTTDNEEATITVGKNIPYLTKIGTTASTETYSNYEYKDVGISLKIKPQINENRLIRLDIIQEVTKLDQMTTVSADRPATLKRTIDTNVIVHDRHTIVIGGLIDDSMTEVQYKVPCLGDIPGLGWLFKTLSDSSDKTNLFVFLTPHVIKTAEEADVVYDEKKAHLESLRKGSFKMYPGAKEQSSGEDVEKDSGVAGNGDVTPESGETDKKPLDTDAREGDEKTVDPTYSPDESIEERLPESPE